MRKSHSRLIGRMVDAWQVPGLALFLGNGAVSARLRSVRIRREWPADQPERRSGGSSGTAARTGWPERRNQPVSGFGGSLRLVYSGRPPWKGTRRPNPVEKRIHDRRRGLRSDAPPAVQLLISTEPDWSTPRIVFAVEATARCRSSPGQTWLTGRSD